MRNGVLAVPLSHIYDSYAFMIVLGIMLPCFHTPIEMTPYCSIIKTSSLFLAGVGHLDGFSLAGGGTFDDYSVLILAPRQTKHCASPSNSRPA